MKPIKKMHPLVLCAVILLLLTGCSTGNSAGQSSSGPDSADSTESGMQPDQESGSTMDSGVSDPESDTGSVGSVGFTVNTLARKAAFNGDGLRLDKNGNVFVGTSTGRRVFRVTPDGEITLFATFTSGSANGSDFDSKGNLYVANVVAGIVQKITPEGEVSDFVTDLDGPAGIYIDEQDNLYVGMFGHSGPAAEVLKITPDRTVTTYASGNGLANVVGVTGDGNGRYFAANFFTGEIFEITGGKVRQIGASETRVNHMHYSNGFIYMPNPFIHVVRRMDLNGNFELIAGTDSVAGSGDGEGSAAKFSRPNSIDISTDGKTIYVLDFNTGDVRTISITQ